MNEIFEENIENTPVSIELIVDVDGYEGPLDVLLTLARSQKVDLSRISILRLAEQYLTWVAEIRHTHIKLAADYLVIAAWLAYLKSRLLLPDLLDEDEPSGEEMAAALQFQLQRLEAMQKCGQALMTRPHLGKDFFSRGMRECCDDSNTITVYNLSLFDLLKTYAYHHQRKRVKEPLRIEPMQLYSVESALQRLRCLLGQMASGWRSLVQFLPDNNVQDPLLYRSAIASTVVASLELAKEGRLYLHQDDIYGDIKIQSATGNF